MTEIIINGIVAAIKTTFGNNYKIYNELVEQGLNRPCFFIRQINHEQKPMLNIRYKDTYLFDISYFPKGEKVKIECSKVENKLYNILEYINVNGDLLRGSNMNSRTEEGILHFFINYTVFGMREKEKDKYMEVLEENGRTKTR